MTLRTSRWARHVVLIVAAFVFAAPAVAQNRATGPAGPQARPVGNQPPGQGPAVQAASSAGQPSSAARQGVPLPPRGPQAPFQLTAQQQQELMSLLRAWEERGAGIKIMYCDFQRFDYSATDGPWMTDPRNQLERVLAPHTKKRGELKYGAPDKGLYHTTQTETYDKTVGDYTKRKEGDQFWSGDHWVCDGQSIWQYDFSDKKLIESKLPPELQGKAISNGPLPFLFGAKADALMQRYFLRLTTPQHVKGEIWLEAHPRYQLDAANFQKATLILDQKTLLPAAMEVILPQKIDPSMSDRVKNRHVHTFQNHVVNDPLRIFKGDFSKPDLPRGWTKVLDNPAPPPGATAQGPPPAKR